MTDLKLQSKPTSKGWTFYPNFIPADHPCIRGRVGTIKKGFSSSPSSRVKARHSRDGMDDGKMAINGPHYRTGVLHYSRYKFPNAEQLFQIKLHKIEFLWTRTPACNFSISWKIWCWFPLRFFQTAQYIEMLKTAKLFYEPKSSFPEFVKITHMVVGSNEFDFVPIILNFV